MLHIRWKKPTFLQLAFPQLIPCWFTVNLVLNTDLPVLSRFPGLVGIFADGDFPPPCMFLPSPEANLLGVERSTSTSEGSAKASVHKCVLQVCVTLYRCCQPGTNRGWTSAVQSSRLHAFGSEVVNRFGIMFSLTVYSFTDVIQLLTLNTFCF